VTYPLKFQDISAKTRVPVLVLEPPRLNQNLELDIEGSKKSIQLPRVINAPHLLKKTYCQSSNQIFKFQTYNNKIERNKKKQEQQLLNMPQKT